MTQHENGFKAVFPERFRMEMRENETQEEFGKRMGISRPTVALYLSGKRTPEPEILYRICKACGCSSDWLLGLSDVRSPSADVRAVCDFLLWRESTLDRLLKNKTLLHVLDYLLNTDSFLQSLHETCRAFLSAGMDSTALPFDKQVMLNIALSTTTYLENADLRDIIVTTFLHKAEHEFSICLQEALDAYKADGLRGEEWFTEVKVEELPSDCVITMDDRTRLEEKDNGKR